MSNSSYVFKLAETPVEVAAYFSLRREIFCDEQQLFEYSDQDTIDAMAYPIVALDGSDVVGVVRIYETQPGHWFGGRLGVHQRYRRRGQIGKGLIYKAVTTANGWGCEQFLATVQLQNVRFFQRQHWASLKLIEVCCQPHHLMQADLDYYPPESDQRPRNPTSFDPLSHPLAVS